jgi:hypothetical protein
VTNFLTWAGLFRGDPTFGDHYAAIARWLVGEVNRAGSPESASGPARYAVTLRRIFNLADRPAGERIRLRLPLPLKDAARGEVAMEVLSPPDAELETVVGPGRLDARVTGQAGLLRLGAGAVRNHLDPAEAELYTRPSEGLIKVSTRVAGLAARLTGDERDPLAVVRRFWTYMLDEMARGAIDYDRLGCAAPLDRGSDVSRCDF